jgi:hypothetical protein
MVLHRLMFGCVPFSHHLMALSIVRFLFICIDQQRVMNLVRVVHPGGDAAWTREVPAAVEPWLSDQT